ncbi:hypothetical protein Tco_0344341 [Tanacetum coccineum]
MPKSAWTEEDQIDNFLKERRHRYSNPMIQPEPEGSTQGYPLDSVEVLRYDTKGEKVRIRNNAILEQTQQGISHEVSVDPHGFEGYLKMEVKKMTRETEVHKFNDDTLMRDLEKLDFRVKDYELFKFNPGIEHRILSEDDKRRSQEFIKLIQRRLKIRRIFRSLESFVH